MVTGLTYSLDSTQLNNALDIVESECKAAQSLARVLRKIIPREIVVARILYIGLTIRLILLFRNFSHAVIFVDGVLAVILLVGLCVLSPEIRAIRRLRYIQSSLGIKQFSWFYEFQRPGKRLLLLALSSLLGLCLPIISQGRSWTLDIIALCSILVFSVIYGQHRIRTLRPVKDLLVRNERLQTILLNKQSTLIELAEGMTISISEADYKEIARIEKALISLDRERTIEQIRDKIDDSERAVQQSITVLQKKSTIEPAIRLKIQTQIDELSANPQPPSARENIDGAWRLPVPETSWDILYTLVGYPQRIVVHDLLKRDMLEHQNLESKDSA